MENHQFDPSILREYDIRGIVGDTLNNVDAQAIGRAYGTMVRRTGGTVVSVGYDGRLSSVEFEKNLVEGLVSTGLTVKRVGLGPSPMLYFSVFHHDTDGGVMITGSHNPPDYNGFKMMLGKKSLHGKAILELGEIAAKGDFIQGEGKVEDVDIHEDYLSRLAQDYTAGAKELKVVWDAGNGATGEMLTELVKRLPGEHHLLFNDIDGRFPNHHPDPTIEANLEDLKRKVAETGADLGIGFDGDGDRIGAVDANGDVVWGDQLIAIYAREVLKSHPGATIISDVKSSQTVFDDIAKHGGQPLMWKSGHSLVKTKMIETKSPLAGEMSGHIFFADKFYGYDDAMYCGVRLLSILATGEQTLAELRDELPDVNNTPEIRFQVDDSRKFDVPEEIKQRMIAAKATVSDVDGVRVSNDHGWWLLRASNTQDALTLRIEAYSDEGMASLRQEVIDQLAASDIPAPSELG